MIPLLSTVPYGIRIAFDGFSVIDSRILESQVKRAMRSVSPQAGLAGEILERPILDRLRDSIVSIDFERVRKTCEEALTIGIPPTRVISEGMAPGMNTVGEKFQAVKCIIDDTEYFPNYDGFSKVERIMGDDGVAAAMTPKSPLQSMLLDLMGYTRFSLDYRMHRAEFDDLYQVFR